MIFGALNPEKIWH